MTAVTKNQKIYEAVVAMIQEEIPGFEVRFKDQEWSSKLIAFLVSPFNYRYMQDYTTTRYPCVYFPSKRWVEHDYRRAWHTLVHEFVHLVDRKRLGPIFNVLYLSPQILGFHAVGALAAIWFPLALWFLPALVLTLPFPAIWRAWLEKRGYAMTMAILCWCHGEVAPKTLESIEQQFVGWSYYKMWPFPGHVRNVLKTVVDDINTGRIFDWPSSMPYKRVYALLQQEGVTLL